MGRTSFRNSLGVTVGLLAIRVMEGPQYVTGGREGGGRKGRVSSAAGMVR
jgi:hypothetical protein